jgi:hypothetical protein
MNTLTLLDYLREIVLRQDKQIFFATANDNVRKLFRRKFSFLEGEMRELNFERASEMKTKITVKTYDQEKQSVKEVISFHEV